ncbi:hypothetical protein F0358_04795 [Empedobacter brevis]|uniref:Right handed beta helix domain-containing protein n=1 Tax=Empedobacter brevis NBRC 14943 = ATCC 43319 TaxID=1218108 RepID=A0A511NIC9_9FLAO|nr:hypothetical protein [Empedobacter brevis]QES92078.1 hypothetical protein F0358_04795 [Empedobacter brevis]GEM52573.1 hypothetical protein EB1_23630 [Empedobacter brevis NBRC 14943 = ATCC 43319]
MKKTIFRAIFCATLLSSTAFVTSCSKDDDSTDVVNNELTADNFRGTVKSGQNLTLDASKTYYLTGIVTVENGATLTIPAGTKFTATGGTSAYIIVDRGGKIFANGTASSPVVFQGINHTPGEWGGLVILGKATSNRSASGESTSELGDKIYGGKESGDNSGSLTYVIIKDSGAKFSDTKEFNGLSLFGVGNGTKIDNIYIENGADDGIEFFGGTVNASNIIVNGVGDDSFDWTEGWSGTGTNFYAKRRPSAINGEMGNRGIEADNQDTNPDATPISNPTLKNVTVVGSKEGSESQGAKLRAGTNGNIDNLVIANFTTGLDIETDRSVNWFNQGGKLTNVRFINVDTKSKGTNSKKEAVDVSKAFTENENATGAGNGANIPTWAAWTGLK